MSQKSKFAFYMPEDLRAELERRYEEDGSRSQTAFVERAVRFYLDYLSTENAGEFLPAAVKACIDGRLGMLENRMASLLYKQAVETDMGISILADTIELDEDYLRRKRAESVLNVKRTNGQLKFEQHARGAGEC